ncbi:MAG TPA: ATP-binding protein [Drouetiella sp.]|jgi:predicted ATPase
MRAVITGGPSVGKTTIVSMLGELGFPVVQEFATAIIKEGEFLPWIDRAKFQAEVLRRQVAAELALGDNTEPIFLDRGLFDGEAYYIYDKLEIPEAFSRLDASKYTVAFLVEELPFFEVNHVRRENLSFTREISVILENCYTSRDVEVIRVPAMSPQERIDFVLSEVKRLQRRELQKKLSVVPNMSPAMSLVLSTEAQESIACMSTAAAAI